jgi:hypothetical protein
VGETERAKGHEAFVFGMVVIREHNPNGNTAHEIYKALSPLIRKDDRLLVQEMAGCAAWDKLLISNEAFKSIVEANAR